MFAKKVFLWGLYDFANSVLMGNLSLYFVTYIVRDKGMPDIFVSLVLTIGAIILLFLAPNLGVLVDRGYGKINLIRFFSIFILIGGILLGLMQNAIFLLILFLIINLSYQLSLVPYNVTLVDIASKEKRGLVSGFGEFSNWAGYIMGLIITLPIINGNINFFGIGRSGVFIPAALVFFILGLPFLLSKIEKPREKKEKIKLNFFKEFVNTIKIIKKREYRGVSIFLLIFLLANNAAVTFTTFVPLYFEVVEKFPDKTKTLLTIIVLMAGAIGAIMGGKLADKYGSIKILSWIMSLWALCLISVIFGSGFWYLLPFVVLVGFLMGGFWAIGRKYLTEIAPASEVGRFFGLHALSVRLSTFLGPPLWSIAAIMFSRYGDNRYKFSMLGLSLLLILSIILLRIFKPVLEGDKLGKT
jgi:UMF1 family MFS transporter